MYHFKYSECYKLFSKVTLICILVFHVMPTIYGLAFLHSSIGVVFSPYVHNEVNYESITHDWSSYNFSDVKLMAKLISTRFPMLVSYGIGSIYHGNDSDQYSWDTNYHRSYSQVYVCEAVAKLNNATKNGNEDKGKNKGKNEDQEFVPLQVYQGVLIPASRLQVDLELSTAIEAVEKANRIFPGTVKGVVFHGPAAIHDDYGNASLLFDAMRKIELRAAQNQVHIGTKQICDGNFLGSDNLVEKRKQIILHSNFIICEVFPSPDMHIDKAVVWAIGEIKKHRKELKTISPWIDVMFETGWAADEGNKSQTEDLEKYWEYMEAWSVKNYVSLWVNEAFDTPWTYWERKAHWGWWKLKNDDGISKEGSYVEKVPHKGEKYTRKTKPKAIENGKKFLEKLEKLMAKNEIVEYISNATEVDTEDNDEIVVPDEES